jgi:aryl-alcohol dehydrogenase-like predicted oxidoreductase
MSDTALPTAVLGRTGLEITRLGFGTALSRKMPDSEWEQLLGAVLDSGINFIDTANDYGMNWNVPAEEQIGKHISGRRSEYYLATKCGCGPGGGDHIWTRENAVRGLEESLGRLKTDYVDIMQYHNPTVEEAEDGDLIAVLQDMRDQGKVRWLGISTTLPHLPYYLDTGVFDTFQIPYSALEREHEDWVARSAEAGIGIIIRGGVAQGEPSGDVNERRSKKWRTFEEAGLDELLEEGESRTTLILRYTLAHPNADTNIVGTSRIGHLEENLAGIMTGPLSADTYAEMKRRLDSVGESPANTG